MKSNAIISVLVGLIVFASCENMLEVEPKLSREADRVIVDKNSAEAAVMGIYDGFQMNADDDVLAQVQLFMSELPSDNIIHTGTFTTYAEAANNQLNAENVSVNVMWTNYYRLIQRANTVIHQLPGVASIAEADKNQLLGEAYFLRAYAYFQMVNFWGGVPLVLKNVEGAPPYEKPARSSKQEVYTQVEKDLTEAESLLPEFTGNGRANAYAAKGLLARLFLYTGNYQKAADKASEVIISGSYSLMNNYSDVFLQEYNPEIMFSIDFSDQDPSNLAYWFYLKDLGRYELAPSVDFVNTLDDEDLRKSALITKGAGEQYQVQKYEDVASNADNVVVLRLAEMYLIRAEAQINGATVAGTTAMDDLNAVRTRAGLAALTESPGMDELMQERRIELAFEGHRWFDLVRTGRAIDEVANVSAENQHLFPIPQAERDVNGNIDQNEGY